MHKLGYGLHYATQFHALFHKNSAFVSCALVETRCLDGECHFLFKLMYHSHSSAPNYFFCLSTVQIGFIFLYRLHLQMWTLHSWYFPWENEVPLNQSNCSWQMEKKKKKLCMKPGTFSQCAAWDNSIWHINTEFVRTSDYFVHSTFCSHCKLILHSFIKIKRHFQPVESPSILHMKKYNKIILYSWPECCKFVY